MKVLGIVVEYNPFHNGHIYHINKAKELVNPDYTIAVMSSSFVQRGEPAIIDKWTRSELAIQYGVDIVVELPFIYSVQSADYFAKGSIELLNAIGVTDLCFGSEDGNIDTFIDIAKAIKENEEHYNNLVKTYMNQGLRYPDACNQSLNDILGKEIRTPNDLLGLSYVKEIIFNNYKMTPHCITRTNDYHGNELSVVASASAIRNAIRNNENISLSLTSEFPFPVSIGDCAIASATFCRFRSRFSVSKWILISVPAIPKISANERIKTSCVRKNIF